MNIEQILNSDLLLRLTSEGIISEETYFQLRKLEEISNFEKQIFQFNFSESHLFHHVTLIWVANLNILQP